MVWNQDPRAELGKLERFTPESRPYLLGVHILGVQPHDLTSHRPLAGWAPSLDELSACFANHASWVAMPSVGCKTVWFFIQGGDSCIVLPQSSCLSHLEGWLSWCPLRHQVLLNFQMKSPGCAIDLNQSNTNKKHGIRASPRWGGTCPWLRSALLWAVYKNRTCCFADGRAGGKKNHHLNSWKERRKES